MGVETDTEACATSHRPSWSSPVLSSAPAMQIWGLSPPSSPSSLPALDHGLPSLTDSSAPPSQHPVPTGGGQPQCRPPRAALMRGALGRVIQSGRSSETHFHLAGDCSHYDLLSSLCLAQAKIKIGFSLSSHRGYRVGNGQVAFKFTPLEDIIRGHHPNRVSDSEAARPGGYIFPQRGAP